RCALSLRDSDAVGEVLRAHEDDKPAPVAPAAPARESSRDLFRSAFSRREEAPAEPESRIAPVDDSAKQDAEDESRIRRAFDELDDARNKRAERFNEEPMRNVGFGDMPERGFAREEKVEEPEEEPKLELPEEEPDYSEPDYTEPDFDADDVDEPSYDTPSFRAPERDMREEASYSDSDLFDDDDDDEDFADFEETPRAEEGLRAPRTVHRTPAAEPVPDTPAPTPVHHVYKQYVHPDMSVFNVYDDAVSVSEEEIERNSAIIKDTLAGFHIDAEVVKVTPASSVTRYDIDVPANVAVRTVMKRDEEIAMRLRARDGVNIYSNSEMGLISVEVPNAVRATVGIRSILQADEYLNSKPNSLMFVLGKDIEGRNVCGNIAKMKHLLVAGSTGSGKSVCLNAMLISLICKYSPEELRLILVDPKKVEFEIFDGLPHLMINEIISDAQKTIKALNWAIKEMERRYEAFSAMTRSGKLVRNLDEYNAACVETGDEKLPKIVIVVDELADLMSVAKKDIEERIQRLAQKARAAGMHLVLATQRPSVDVITGVIKTNLPTRIAFRVGAEVDSRTILDESGAEKLLGNGDMLYHTDVMYNCLRVQGAYISSKEVEMIVKDIKEHNEAYFDNSVAEFINKSEQTDEEGGEVQGGGEVDAVYIKALGIVVKLGTASISLIQRKCSVGYNHAGKIIEWMEAMNYISPFEGKAKPRTVLMTPEQFENIYGKLD
ncbi:MAG: DNA translocase FtsK, partial [Clostridia bacterium]|nr:DNA translocase FtsK [Clostridia bacterium]